MAPRIALDLVRRKWRAILFGVFQFYLFVQTITLWPWMDPMGVVLVGAGLFGVMPLLALQSRELYQLPVSRRAWAEAEWWLAVGGAATIPVIGVTIGLWVNRSEFPSIERMAMYSLFAFLYCGCALVLRRTFPSATEAPATLTNLAVSLPISFALAFASLLLGARLPHRFADIGAGSAVAILLMGALTARGYRHQPQIAPRPSRGGPSLWDSWKQSLKTPVAAKGASSRLTGLPLAFLDEARRQLLTFSLLVVAGFALWAASSQLRPTPPFDEVLRLVDALPFASHRASDFEPMTWSLLFIFVNSFSPWILRSFRPLRALPLSTTRLSCLPLALGFVSAVVLWGLLLVLHLLVLASVPVSPRVDLFAAVAGLASLTHTIRFILPAQPAVKGMAGLAPIMIVLTVYILFLGPPGSWRPDIVQPGMLAGGLVMMAGSFLLMRNALTRSSRMYRQPAVAMRFR